MEMTKLTRRLSHPSDLPAPPTDLPTLDALERELTWPFFTADHAWYICVSLRDLLHKFGAHAVINISLASSDKILAHATTPGTTPDNDVWISRKRRTVLRFGHSSWYMRTKFKGDERVLREKVGAGEEGGYAIHGGGFPIRVKGVEGVVAVVVVSGLKQEWDHQVVVEVVRAALLDEMEVTETRRKQLNQVAEEKGQKGDKVRLSMA
jgi:uncharacterized protein (UPF0303 family)